MNNFVLIFVLTFLSRSIVLSLSFDESDNECKETDAKSVMLRLKKYLFCDYVWSDHDSKSNTTYVNMEMLPLFVNMDEYYSNLELYTSIYIAWTDKHLTWDPALYDNIRHIKVFSSEIWVPDIAVQSPGNNDANEDGLIGTSQCEATFDGKVYCSPRHRQTIRCQTDFTLWPFDRQNCTLIISSLAHMGRQMAFVTANNLNKTISLHQLVNNGEWGITVSRVAYDQMKANNLENFTLPKLSIDFILDRVHSHLSARYVTPGIIMIVMTVTTLWLDPRSSERLAIACLNPVIHLLCIRDLNWILPHSGNSVPNIVLFYINSFGLSIFALLLTIFLGNLHVTKSPAPKWISSATSSMLASKIGQIWLLSVLDPTGSANTEREAEDNRDLVSPESHKPIWNYVVVFLGRLSFFFFFFTYVVMWAVLIPNSSMKTPIEDVS